MGPVASSFREEKRGRCAKFAAGWHEKIFVGVKLSTTRKKRTHDNWRASGFLKNDPERPASEGISGSG
jgi:hypothetical protein